MQTSGLDTHRLRVLVELDETRSFSRAAESLGYTQSAVSHQIAALEREATVRLVERTRPIHLTPAGARLAAHARAALSILADAARELQGSAEELREQISVAAFPSACATLIPKAVIALRRSEPGLRVSFVDERPSTAVEGVRDGRYDLALVFRGPDPRSAIRAPLIETVLFEDPLLVQVPHGDPLARREAVDLRELADADWVAPGAGDFRALFETLCEDCGFHPRYVVEPLDRTAGQGLVAAGVGLCIATPMALARLTCDGIAVLELRGVSRGRTVSVVTAQDRLSLGAEMLLNELRKVGPPSTHAG